MSKRSGVKKRKETIRLKRLCTTEHEVREKGFEIIAGVDEVGRGPLAGPVVAAACILPEGYILRGINDSKKLTEEQRFSLYQELISQPGLEYGIGVVEAAEIDELNIHRASQEAMVRAVKRLRKTPQFLLVDGPHTPPIDIPSAGIVDGDAKVQAIAAASVIAKVTRDNIMIGYHGLYPGYGFKDHKGYGTAKHLKALSELGPSPIHRMTFRGGKNDQEHDSLQPCNVE